MSTRSTTHFMSDGVTRALIYRHYDGYPEGHGWDLGRFFDDVEAQTQDHRYNDPSYLAAKLVVWLADEFKRDEQLDFLGVGVMMEDPGDIEFLYEIDCDEHEPSGRPAVRCYEVKAWGERGDLVTIPAQTEQAEDVTA